MMLQTFEPTMLPTETSLWPDSAASRLTDSSGALVPTATMVAPIAIGLMPIRSAMNVEAETSMSQPR